MLITTTLCYPKKQLLLSTQAAWCPRLLCVAALRYFETVPLPNDKICQT